MVDRSDHNVDREDDDMEDMDRPAHEMTNDLRVTERTYVKTNVNVNASLKKRDSLSNT